MRPELQLAYSSGSGNGPLGVGWSLRGLSSVGRCKRTLAQDGAAAAVKLVTNDAYCLDGQRLVPVSGANGNDGTEYRTERESFVRVFSHGDSATGPVYWEAQLPSGVRRYYGDNWPHQGDFYPSTQHASFGGTGIVVTDNVGDYHPSATPATLLWSLARSEDRVGNYYDVLYTVSGTGAPNSPIEQYPTMIVYTGFDTVDPPAPGALGGASGALQALRSVVFQYESRPDPIDGYTAGLHRRTSERLTQITGYGPSPDGISPVQSAPSAIQTRYTLAYDNASISGRSLLSTIQECDGAGTCLPSTRFGWSPGIAGFQVPQAATLVGTSPEGIFNPTMYPGAHYRVLDANGDGKADLVAMDPNGPVQQTAPTFSAMTNLCEAAGQGSASTSCQITRQTSDTQCDRSNGSLTAEWQLQYLQGDGAGHFTVPPSSAAIPFQTAPNVDRPVDINHDGFDDLILDNQFETNVICQCSSGIVVTCLQDSSTEPQSLNGGAFEWELQALSPASGAQFWSFDAPSGFNLGQSYFVDIDGNGVLDMVRTIATQLPGDGCATNWGAIPGLLFGVPGGLITSIPGGIPAGESQVGLWVSGQSVNPGPNGQLAPTGSNMSLSPIPSPPAKGVRAIDFDGDGTTNMLYDVGGTFETFQGQQATPTWFVTTYPEHSQSQCQVDADINGDGLPDVVNLDLSSGALDVRAFLNVGGSYLQVSSSTVPAPNVDVLDCTAPDPGIRVTDFDGDGSQDLFLLGGPAVLEFDGMLSPRLVTLASPQGMPNTTGFQVTRPSDGPPTTDPPPYDFHMAVCAQPGWPQTSWDLSEMTDIDGDGLADILQVDGTTGKFEWLRRLGTKPDLLDWVIEGGSPDDGLTSYVVTYATLADPTVYSPTTSSCPYPEECLRAEPLSVVKEHDQRDGVGGMRRFTYQYVDGRADLRGRGWLGFAERIIVDVSSGSREYRWFDNATNDSGRLATQPSGVDGFPIGGPYSYPYAHLANETERTVCDATSCHVNDTQLTYESSYETIYGSPTDVMVVDTRSRQETYAENGVLVQWTNTTYEHDAFGNVTDLVTANRIDGSRYERSLPTSPSFGGPPNPINDTTNWILGLPTDVQETSTPSGGAPVTRERAYVYYPGTGLTELELVDPQGTYPELIVVGRNNAYGVVDSIGRWGMGDANGYVYRQTLMGRDSEWLYPVTVTDPLRHTTYWTYEPSLGVPAVSVDPNGLVTQWQYDGFGRLRAVTPPDSGATTIAYSSDPGTAVMGVAPVLDVQVSTMGGETLTTRYDVLGRPVAKEWIGFDGYRYSREASYNALGQMQTSTCAHFETNPPNPFIETFPISYGYDAFGRPTSVVWPEGWGQTTLSYSLNKVHKTDRKGNASTVTTDSNGRVIESDEAVGTRVMTKTKYSYGAFGELATIVDPSGSVTRFDYDEVGRRTDIYDPDSGHEHTVFNTFGEIMMAQDQKDLDAGTSSQTYRDLGGRPIKLTNRDGETDWAWDTAFMGIGRLASTVSPSYRDLRGNPVTVYKSVVYDSTGRLSQESTKVGADTFLVALTYDSAGRMWTLQYPAPDGTSPFTTQNTYSANDGTLARVDDITHKAPVLLWKAQQVDADGDVVLESYGNGMTTERSYGPPGTHWLDTIYTWHTSSNSQTGTPQNTYVQLLSYTHDPNGNVTFRGSGVGPGDGASLAPSQSETFVYDALDRLKSATVQSGASGGGTDGPEEAIAYESSGNIKSTGLASLYNYGSPDPTTCGAATFAGPHALTTLTLRGGATEQYCYDVNGDQIRSPGPRTLEYTAFHLPIQMALVTNEDTTVPIARFAYDAAGQRTARYDQGGSTVSIDELYERRMRSGEAPTTTHRFYVHAGARIVAQLDWDQRPGAPPTSGATYYFHGDINESTDTVTNQSGAVAQRGAFDAFGLPRNANWMRGSSGPPTPGSSVTRGFDDLEQDDAGGLINMRGRMYDPTSRRFVSVDPIVHSIGAGQTINPYSYVANNPLTFVDPSGLVMGGTAEDPSGTTADPGPAVGIFAMPGLVDPEIVVTADPNPNVLETIQISPGDSTPNEYREPAPEAPVAQVIDKEPSLSNPPPDSAPWNQQIHFTFGIPGLSLQALPGVYGPNVAGNMVVQQNNNVGFQWSVGFGVGPNLPLDNGNSAGTNGTAVEANTQVVYVAAASGKGPGQTQFQIVIPQVQIAHLFTGDLGRGRIVNPALDQTQVSILAGIAIARTLDSEHITLILQLLAGTGSTWTGPLGLVHADTDVMATLNLIVQLDGQLRLRR